MPSQQEYSIGSLPRDWEISVKSECVPYALDSESFAQCMDDMDPLKDFRSKFVYPKKKQLPIDFEGEDEECIYLCSHSLGLKPKKADEYINEQLSKWGERGMYMYFTGHFPAAQSDLPGRKITADLVGAVHEHEVALMNGLSVNLQLFMMAFFRPDEKRNKILIEDQAFPSDRYAVQSLLEWHNLDPTDHMIFVKTRPREKTFKTEDIANLIETRGSEIALVLLPGVQSFTGQCFDMATITRVGREMGCVVGWDLAHAIGNVPLKLNEWGSDFAVWGSNKYLNSGAGGIGGAFLHDRHASNPPPHLMGWWSNSDETRMQMKFKCDPTVGAGSFRLCTPPHWLACLNMASLEIFEEAGLDRIFAKQALLTGYLEHLLQKNFSSGDVIVTIVTPKEAGQRGSQLTLEFSVDAKIIHQAIQKEGVVCDLRGNKMRVTPVPLYNSFHDVWRFIQVLKEAVKQLNK